MADKTYIVTVASGALFPSGGTGNVYYLDGVRPTYDINTVSNYTLRFNQDDASNNNHPMVFKQTTGSGSLLSTGVTYNLDGVNVTEVTWTNSTNFNAATTRYVEYTPPNELDFIWMCYVHGTGMGGNGIITQNTWGALSWNNGEWGAQNNATISVTNPNDSAWGIDTWSNYFWGGGGSMDAALADVTVTGEVNSGWGRADGWGQQLWGNNNEGATITGQALTGTLASVTITAEVNSGWSAQTWGFSTWGAIGDAVATGQAMTATLASVTITAEVNAGWGGRTWGFGNWGDINNSTTDVTGFAMSANLSSVTAFLRKGWGATTWSNGGWGTLSDTTAIVDNTNLLATFAIGTETVVGEINRGWGRSTWGSLVWNGFGQVIPTGIQMTSSAGSVTVDAEVKTGWGRVAWGQQGWNANTTVVDVNVTGQAMTATLGNETVVGEINRGWGRYGWGDANWGSPDNTIIPTSLAATMALGNADPAPDAMITGIAMTMNDGDPGPIQGDATVIPTGNALTIASGTANTLIWNQVNTGTAPTWKEVDTAA